MHKDCQHHRADKGFTLIELMVAIAVFSVMAVMAYGGLSQIIENNRHSRIELERLQVVQRAMLTINRDINQIIARNIRDEYGNPQPYINAGNNLDYLIEFTRSGRRNPAELKRSNLLRVAYQLKDNKLIRLFWPQLDRAPTMQAYENELIDRVKSIDFRYLDDKKEWHTDLPPLADSGKSQLKAIELTLELEDWGTIKRLYQVRG
ncbi:MAG: type II secretion system minor pseudopilin GspJ [Gammaproteobacteria bacterium]|nr:type II secretion system minor pseudopilin GspJ [Gammaproteobacteria bacterium]